VRLSKAANLAECARRLSLTCVSRLFEKFRQTVEQAVGLPHAEWPSGTVNKSEG
jgi:hypothetical protein